MTNKTSNQFSPTDFMKARRPDLYSDTVFTEKPVLERCQFEFYLDTLTQRKEEIRFEHFCRRLAEKEICPNLLPQTGPTGGGDSKVDSETYPVAEDIAERWYEGDPRRAARERWAFAFSAKKKWRPKVKDDVRKIAGTGRGYSLIYFMTNQAVRDRDRAVVEDALREQWGDEVRILDRSWIVEKVIQNNRWSVVYQTLEIERPRIVQNATLGPLDAERLRDLEELDHLIEDQTRYKGSKYQLAEDCLQTAILARGLGRSRVEIDGRFDRSERIARDRDDSRQLFRILYQRAWTANWWFDDFKELDRLYEMAVPLAIDSKWVWDLEKLVNLWQAGNTWRQVDPILHDAERWSAHTTRLRESLIHHSTNPAKPTSALWARTQLVLMDLIEAASNMHRMPSVLSNIRGLLKEAEGHLEYPVEPVIRLVQELGRLVGDDEKYDELIEEAIQFQTKRFGDGEQGRMRLERAFQKLQAGKTYDAIEQFSMAQSLLVQEEHKDEFVRSLVGSALGYEAAGLLWAARANLIVALDRTLYEFIKGGPISPQSLALFRKLFWVELQLGRVPCVLIWAEWIGIIGRGLELDEKILKEFDEELLLADGVFGILILKTRFADWPRIEYACGLLEQFSFHMSRGAALFALGHEDDFRSEYKMDDDDLDRFFALWLQQPAALDLPVEAEWHIGKSVALKTVILGCEIELVAENRTTSILLGETILAFLETFLSTEIRREESCVARSNLIIEIQQSEHTSSAPFTHRIKEDDCGEARIIVMHTKIPSSDMVRDPDYQKALFNLLAGFISQLHGSFSPDSIKELLTNDSTRNRAFWSAQSLLSLTNILSEDTKYHLQDWKNESLTESHKLLRTKPWQATNEQIPSKGEVKTTSFMFSKVPPLENMSGVDSLKHRDIQILSPINLALWDSTYWRGLGFSLCPGDPPVPVMMLLFEDQHVGEKIFRGWRKRIGEKDQNEWISLTLVTGINRHHPANYRLVISANYEHLLSNEINTKGKFLMVCRMQDMTPADNGNLDRFQSLYEKAGCYQLAPSLFSPEGLILRYAHELSIEKRRLRIVPAWKIGPTDPVCPALKGIVDPLIPPDVSAPPILKVIKQFSDLKK